jgi:hypothetical protein
MTAAFPGGEPPPPPEPEPPQDIRAFTLAEHMIGEEYALLQIPERERSEAQHRRLRTLEHELDRLWDALRRRAEALGKA